MESELVRSLIEDRQAQWSAIAIGGGPGCAKHGLDNCLCDVVIPDRNRETLPIPPYERTRVLRDLWQQGTRRSMLDWFAAVAVIADLEALARHYEDGVSALRIAYQLPPYMDSGRKAEITFALAALFDQGLNLGQIIALSGIPPVDLLSALSYTYMGDVDKANRLVAADKLMRERVCPSSMWVARQVGLDHWHVRTYAQRWSLKTDGVPERSTRLQVRQRIEELARTTSLKTGAIVARIKGEFTSSDIPKYMAVAQIVSRTRRSALAVAV